MIQKIYIKSRRGAVHYFLESAFRIFFLMVALLVFFLLVNYYINNRIDTNGLQAEVTANRIIYSDAIMHQEGSRTYTGIIDVTKFSSTIIEDKINYGTKRHATAKLEIVDNTDGKVVGQPAYLNKAQYDNLLVLINSHSQGQGSATGYIKNYPITYYTADGDYKYGTLVMDIIIPNS